MHVTQMIFVRCLLLVSLATTALTVSTAAVGHARNGRLRHRGRHLKQLDRFPYMLSDGETFMEAWKARLVSQQDMVGNTLVRINVWANENCTKTVGQIRIAANKGNDYGAQMSTFSIAQITWGNTTSEYEGLDWNSNRPYIQLKDLRFTCGYGQRLNGYNMTGYTIDFLVFGGSMSTLCNNRGCAYALKHNVTSVVGNLGYVPSIVTEGPGFDQSGGNYGNQGQSGGNQDQSGGSYNNSRYYDDQQNQNGH